MSWQKLEELIQTMDDRRKGKKSGEAFERLVIQILESLLKIKIIQAKSSSQPSGDARSEDGKLSLQAKNYSNGKDLKLNNIVRDVHRARNTLPELEVYVLAVSCFFAQDRDELDDIEKDTFLEIVILELTDGLSDLGSLCVTFWRDLENFDEFSTSCQNQEFFDWMEKQRQNPKVKEKVEKLKHRFEQHIQTQNYFQIDAQDIFLKRIGDKASTIIDLSKVKVRHEYEFKLDNWWKNNEFFVCFLEGEKNSGKTWLAANWVKSICNNKNIAPIWLEKHQWDNIQSLDDLQNACFKSIYGITTERKIKQLKQKLSCSWNNPTLIILDGLSKRDKISLIDPIIYDYFYQSRIVGKTKWGHSIFLLFTTLSLNGQQNIVNNQWKDYIFRIKVDPFCENESQITLTTDVPQSISLHNLWTKLVEKIESTDSHERVDLGWSKTEKAQEILSRLAQQTKWTIIDSANHLSAQLLKKSFSNYRETRLNLEEKLVAIEADDIHVEVSKDHVILGWALYLSHLFESWVFTTIKDFTDRFHHELESLLSEDLITKALFIVLQITAVFPKKNHASLSQKRTALLLVLLNCPNPVLTQERLLFWAEQDTETYVQFVQSAFKNQILPYEEEAIVGPLSHTWNHKYGQVESIASCLDNWLFQTDIEEIGEKVENVNHEQEPFPTMYYTQKRLSAAALSILSQRPERQFLRSIAKLYEDSKENVQFQQDIGRLLRWGFTESILEDLHSLAEQVQSDEHLIKGFYGLAVELKRVDLPGILQRPLSEIDKKIHVLAEQLNSTFKSPINRIRDQEQILKGDSAVANVKGSYHDLDYLAVRTDLPDLSDDDFVKIREVLQHISENTKLGTGVDTSREDNCIQNLIPWIGKYDAEDYAELACNLKINTLPQEWAQFKLLSIQGIIFKPEDCKRITEAILGIKEQLAQGVDFYSEVTWLTHLLTETLLFCASEEILTDWFIFLASHGDLRCSICYESLPYLFEYLLPPSIVELAQKNLEELRNSSHEDHNPSDHASEEFSEEEYWCTLFAYASKVEDKTVKYALEDLKTRKPDSIGTFPMLRLAYSDPKLLLNETLIDENIQKHLFSQNGRKWTIRTYDGNDVASYELLRSFIPPEFIGSFFCRTDRCDDLSRWGKDIMKWVFSILDGNEGDSNSVKEDKFGINREVFQTWAEQNQSDFLRLSDAYLTNLSKSPWYRQALRDYTDSILCLIMRFQPNKAMDFYQQSNTEGGRTIYYNQYRIDTFLAQLWQVEQCDSEKHVQLRRTVLEQCQNDQEIMFITIAAMSGGGEKELLDLVEKEYLDSEYAKERNLSVSILPWFGSDEVIELLDQLKSDDPSLWVRGHAAWAYEVAQQERSCRTVYREALQTRDLFQISAAFERMKSALSPTARWWHRQIEEELGLNSESQEIDPKLIALVYRFWYRWGKSSKTRRDIEIFGRKLKEYCRGEKIGSVSQPRLAPWWKPTQ